MAAQKIFAKSRSTIEFLSIRGVALCDTSGLSSPYSMIELGIRGSARTIVLGKTYLMVPTTKSSNHTTLADRYAATHGFGPALMPHGDKKTMTLVSLITIGEAKTRLHDETGASTYVKTTELLAFLRKQFVALPYDSLPELRDRWLKERAKASVRTATPNTSAPGRNPALEAMAAAARALVRRSILLSGATMTAADDLKRIRGIGVLIESRLTSMGIVSYAQIASWTQEDVGHIESELMFHNRIGRENWVEQAQVLAAGGATQFSQRVDKGELPVNIPDYLPFERSDIID